MKFKMEIHDTSGMAFDSLNSTAEFIDAFKRNLIYSLKLLRKTPCEVYTDNKMDIQMLYSFPTTGTKKASKRLKGKVVTSGGTEIGKWSFGDPVPENGDE